MGERIGLTDEEWTVINPLLPAESGRGCRPAQDNRRYFEGMLWMARYHFSAPTGCLEVTVL